MHRLITAALLVGATLLVAPAAYAADRPAYEREYLANYVELRERHGADAPGCNLVTDRYGNRCKKGEATRARVKKSNATLERMLYVPPAVTSTSTAAAPVVGGGALGDCGSLPDYIVARESPTGVNSANGQYLGCAQVDRRHFGEWGTCPGLAYVACVDKLWDGGNGISNWPTAFR